MSKRHFVERDHPRWPAGTGDKSGEFRDKAPAWARRLSDSIDGPDTAGRHGSVATGLEQKCPVCGRFVKIVGAGKLSTHNNPATGQRCTGSGAQASVRPRADIQRAPGGARPPAAKKTPPARQKLTTGRPPRPPQIPYGNPLDPVDDRRARDRLAKWRSIEFADSDAKRQAQIYQARRDIRDWERRYETSRMQVARDLARQAQGLPSWSHVSIPADEAEQFFEDADLHNDVAYSRRSLESRRADLDRLLAIHPSEGVFNPEKPLHYYGDLLHIEGDDWHIYEALDELEQQVPPVFHRVVAEFMRDQQRSVPSSGMYIGSTQSVRDMDDLRRKITSPPRGDWAKNATMATWDEVDGVVSHDSILAVVHTPNAESHRRTRRTALDRAEAGGTRATGSAMLHEFGHVLDHALGFYENRWRTTPSGASEQRRWRLLYGRVKRDTRLSPHFTQAGDAGPREFWADTFYTWSAIPEPRPVQTVSSRTGRQLTTRDLYMAHHYRMSMSIAVDIVDYFDRLEKEVSTGRRLPAIEVDPTTL